jgi:hypothetical protein
MRSCSSCACINSQQSRSVLGRTSDKCIGGESDIETEATLLTLF